MANKRIAPAAIGVLASVIALNANADSVNLGTVAYATNVNASIFNAGSPSEINTYTYNQLLQNPATAGTLLPNGNSVAQELTLQDYGENDGVLNYAFNFTFPAGGSSESSGSFVQDGSPSFSVTNPDIGLGILQSFTATSQSGPGCTGYNNVGATISVDPTNAASTYALILGCQAFTDLNPGFPTSTTSTVALDLGTYGGTTYTGEEIVTTWEASGTVGETSTSAAPEPSLLGLETAGMIIAMFCANWGRKRFRKLRQISSGKVVAGPFLWVFAIAILMAAPRAYAAAGTAGGGETVYVSNDYTGNIVFGTISLNAGSPVDFVAVSGQCDTSTPNCSGVEMMEALINGIGDGPLVYPMGLDSRITSGLNTLISDQTSPKPFNNDDIEFSSGAIGYLDPASFTDPSDILQEAALLGVPGFGPSTVLAGSSLNSDGSAQITGSQTSTQNVPLGNGEFEVVATVDDYSFNMSLQQLDIQAAGQISGTPEPSDLILLLACFGVVLICEWRKKGQ